MSEREEKEKEKEWERWGSEGKRRERQRDGDEEEECMRSVGKRRNETGEAFSKKAESEKKADEYDYLMISLFFCI